MVRISCFNTHIHRHRTKRSVEGVSEREIREDESKSKGLNSIISSTVTERVWKSEEIKSSGILEHDIETHHLRKSQSHGTEQYLGERDATENGTDRITSPSSLEQSDVTHEAGSSKSVKGSQVPQASVSDKDSHQLDDTSLSGDQMDNSNSQTTLQDSPLMVRSISMPNIADSASEKSSSSHHSRSSDDLFAQDVHQTDKFVHETDIEVNQDQDHDRDYDIHKPADHNNETYHVEDGYDDAYDAYVSPAKDWIVPSNQLAEYPGKDFKCKRIRDWVNDLLHINLSDEADEITECNELNEPTTASANVGAITLTPGMELQTSIYLL